MIYRCDKCRVKKCESRQMIKKHKKLGDWGKDLENIIKIVSDNCGDYKPPKGEEV